VYLTAIAAPAARHPSPEAYCLPPLHIGHLHST